MVVLGKGDAKLLGWVGDMVPYGQANAAFTAATMANERRDTVERFLRAYRKGARDYHDAFTGPDEKRRDGPTAPAILDIIAKYTGRPAGQVKLTITYNDPAGRLDVADVLHQIAWYKAQGMVKSEVDGEALIDKRYVVTLP
jgi:NitT/TauT family transport system substrate-binding protein